MIQQFRFEFTVFSRVVRAVLRFPVIEAIGAAAHSEDGGSLNAFGDSHARKEVPPALEVLDKCLGSGEIFLHEARGAAEIFLDRSLRVPSQQVLRRSLLPALDEGTEEIIVIRITDRIALSLIYVLRAGELCARDDIDDALRDDFPGVDSIVQVVCELVDLVLPKISKRREESRLIAIERGVAYRRLRFVGIAGKAAPEGGPRHLQARARCGRAPGCSP